MSAPDSHKPIVALRNVSRAHDAGAVVALRDATFAVYPGDTIAVLGRSGSGKSTIINLLCGLDEPTSGCVEWNGAPPVNRAEWTKLRALDIGIVFQDFLLLPALTALQNVEAALTPGAGAHERRDIAFAALERVGLAHRASHLPNRMSGGERQRVAIARAAVNRPRLLLADEPTGNLDSASAQAIEDLLFDLSAEHGNALVLVTHDADRARRCARTIHVADGRIIGP